MERIPLEEMLTQGMSLEAIARSEGLHPSTVGYWVRKHGLAAANAGRFARRGPPSRQRLEELAAAGATLREIATAVDRSIGTVRHWLRAWQIDRVSTRPVRRPLDPDAAPRDALMVCSHHGHTVFRLDSRGSYRCCRCRQDRVTQRRRNIKRILVEEAGGSCAGCGYHACVAAMHFHHVDPATKAFALASEGVTRSIERARTEAAKCVLLCANCHAEVEAGVRALQPEGSPGWIRTTKN